MFQMVAFTRPQVGWTLEDFLQHYRTTHFDSATRLPGLVSYQQFKVLHGDQGWSQPDHFDGFHTFSIYTFDSREDAIAAFASPEGQANEADANSFMDRLSVRETAVVPLQQFSAAL